MYSVIDERNAREAQPSERAQHSERAQNGSTVGNELQVEVTESCPKSQFHPPPHLTVTYAWAAHGHEFNGSSDTHPRWERIRIAQLRGLRKRKTGPSDISEHPVPHRNVP